MATQTDNSSQGSNSRPDDKHGDSENEDSGLSKTTQGEAMAEETQTDRAAKKSSKKGPSSKKKTAKRAAAKKKSATPAVEALATEQPVPSTPLKKTSQYVVTVDNQTGLPVKIEKLDATGKRKELTGEEYGQALAFGSLPPTSAGEMESLAQASAEETDTLVKAYYQGIADYINALTSNG
jgi:hypothetical protein